MYHSHILNSRRPISMPRPHWLHHQQTAWRLSYGNPHLQGARPFGPQAHAELVTTRGYGSPMFVSSVIGSASLLMFVACSASQQMMCIHNVSALQLHFVSIANVLHLHCACSSFVACLYCACMHERHTHTRMCITDTCCADGMQSKLGMRVATLFQRLPIPLEF